MSLDTVLPISGSVYTVLVLPSYATQERFGRSRANEP